MANADGGSSLFPDYAKGEQRRFRTAIDDTSFSPEVKAKVQDWHRRSNDLLCQLDEMLLRRRRALDPHIAEAERLCDEARAILACLRSALAEVLDAADPLGEAIRRVKARLPPLAPAAAQAVCDLTDTEISAVRALNRSPPPVVRIVVCSCCLLLKLGTPARSSVSGTAPSKAALPLPSWEEAQAMLARPDFARALKGYDPRALHAHAATAQSLRQRLASLGNGGHASTAGGGADASRSSSNGSVRQGLSRAAREARATPATQTALRALSTTAVVAQVAMLNAAVRSGGRAVGQLYLWCARVLAEAEALEEEEALVQAQEEESSALAATLERAQSALDEADQWAVSLGAVAPDG